MSNLQYRQDKIKAKRMKTDFRDFVMEIASWRGLSFYKGDFGVQKFPITNRIGNVIDYKKYKYIDGLDFGLVYEGDFWNIYKKLFITVPKSNVFHYFDNQNCDYADQVHASKNGYLTIGMTGECDSILYSFFCKESKNIINSICVADYSENIYQSAGIYKSYKIFYSKYIFDSNNVRFSTNLQGCSECVLCDNLINQSYCINNIKYNKDEYFIKKNKILQNKFNFSVLYSNLGFPNNLGSSNSDGSFVINCQNTSNGFFAYKIHNGRNIAFGGGSGNYENLYDIFTGGGCAHQYGVIFAGGKSQHIYCSIDIGACSNMYYCMYCNDSSFCFGCIGLKNKSYCILNKQYTKEEWYEKVDEIFAQMEADGTLGEFFPATMNPFYFNDTAAYLIDPSFTKEEVVAKGYLWRDEPIKVDIPDRMELVESKDLGKYESFDKDGNRSIDPIILKKTIRDEEGNIYRVIKLEYDFLVKYGLPLPRKHRLTRMKENFRIN